MYVLLDSPQVFYGPHSMVFPEAENRKWTIMACFEYVAETLTPSWLFGRRAL